LLRGLCHAVEVHYGRVDRSGADKGSGGTVVFSFFKKDPKAGNKPRTGKPGGGRSTAPGQTSRTGQPKPLSKPLAQPVNRGLGNTSTPSSSPASAGAIAATNAAAKELARSQAMATAAKIDQIESEMARDFLRPPGEPKAANTLSPPPSLEVPTLNPPTASSPVTGVARMTTVNGALTRNGMTTIAGRPDDDLDFAAEDLEGAAAAIEISTGTSSSAIEEGAILFANGQAEAAEAVLRAAIDADDLGAQKIVAWLMLFELLNQRGDQAAYEKLSTVFAMRFQSSPPGWIDYAGLQQEAARAAAPAGPVVTLPATLDANIVKQFDELKAKAATSATVVLDVSAVRSVDLSGAELLLRVINAFKKSTQELIVQGVEQLLTPLRGAVEAGRRESSDAAWLLLLEVLRLLGRQDDFDETGIQYCITFELSPPSWEPPPANLKARAASSARPAAGPTLNPLDWRGVIAAESEQLFNRLLAESRTNKHLSVECMQLRRMAFASGSSLLTHVMKLRQAGASVEFRNVNALINALFHLLGISALSTVQQRRG
jgi:ABC-type transporter Mla MlaB component